MTPRIRDFWNDVREELRRKYGQRSGHRDRKILERRRQLADRLGINHMTLKGFLNRHQIGLGPIPLTKLLDLEPEIRAKYKAAIANEERNGEDDAQMKFEF